MKKLLSVVSAVSLVGGVAANAPVAATMHEKGEGAAAQGTMAEKEEMKGKHKKDMKGKHKMSGTVSEVDTETGKVSLDTAAGALDLHFPPTSVQDLKKGDEITVHLGFSKGDKAMKEGSGAMMKEGSEAAAQ